MVEVSYICGKDGFAFITQDNQFLSHCMREVTIGIWPYAFYVLLGWIRFSSLVDEKIWSRLVVSILWNERVPFRYKVAQTVKFGALITCLFFLDLSIFIPEIETPVIVYVVDSIKLVAWVFCLVNCWFEISRNKPTWWATKLFWLWSAIAVLFREVYHIQSEYFNKKFTWGDVKGMFGLPVVLGHVVLIGLTVVLFIYKVDTYKDPVKEAEIEKTQSAKVKVRFRDLLQVFLWGWYLLIPGFIFSSLQATAVMLISQRIGDGIELSDSTTRSDLNKLITPFYWLIPIAALSTILQMSFLGTASEVILMRLKNCLFGTFTRQDMTFFNQTGAGLIVSRLTADADIVGTTLKMLSQVAEPLVRTIVGVVLLMRNSPSLGSITIGMLVITWIVTTIRSRIITLRYSAMYSDERAKSANKATECIQGFEVIRTYGQDKLEKKKFSKLAWGQAKIGSVKEMLEALFESVEFLLDKLIIVLAVYIGGVLVIQKSMKAGQLNSFIILAFQVIESFYSVVKIAPELWNGFAPLGRVFELIRRRPMQNIDHGTTIPPQEFEGGIEFKNVTFSYPSLDGGETQNVLEDFNLTIQPGERVAFVGQSGSGKSTVLSLVLRYFDVKSGSIKIDGRDLRDIQPRWWLNQVGLVSQSSILFKGSIEDNVKYSCAANPGEYLDWEKYEKALQMASAKEVIEIRDEGDHFDVGPGGNNLSGGQRQRIAIARCIRKEAKLLIFDEVTSALDPESESLVVKGLNNLSRGDDQQVGEEQDGEDKGGEDGEDGKQGGEDEEKPKSKPKTTLCVAHRLHTIADFDKIVVMKKGKILEVGNHAELMKQPDSLYKHMFETQQELSKQEPVEEKQASPMHDIEQLCSILESNQFYHDSYMQDLVKRIRKTQSIGSMKEQADQIYLHNGSAGNTAPPLGIDLEKEGEYRPLLNSDHDSDDSDDNGFPSLPSSPTLGNQGEGQDDDDDVIFLDA